MCIIILYFINIHSEALVPQANSYYKTNNRKEDLN